jgi:hypothetical protein
MEISIIFIFLAGAFGALAKDILKDNELEIPKFKDGKIALGFLGGAITGGIAGYLIDGSIETAFMAGFTGSAIFSSLLTGKKDEAVPIEKINEAIIRQIAKEECVDPDLAVRVATCESSLNHKAKNVNTGGSIDRGLYQINSKWHPEVTEAEAFDPIFSAHFFCKAFKDGNISWWEATKTCWDK